MSKSKRVTPKPPSKIAAAPQVMVDEIRRRMDEIGSIDALSRQPECPVHRSTLIRALAGLPLQKPHRFAIAGWLGMEPR
jgi:hypothetical protein